LPDCEAYRVQAVLWNDVAGKRGAGLLRFAVGGIHRGDQRRQRVVDDERRERMCSGIVVLRAGKISREPLRVGNGIEVAARVGQELIGLLPLSSEECLVPAVVKVGKEDGPSISRPN